MGVIFDLFLRGAEPKMSDEIRKARVVAFIELLRGRCLTMNQARLSEGVRDNHGNSVALTVRKKV